MRLTSTELRAELERWHPESFGWALACCRFDDSEAKETLQVSYVKVLEGRARFRGESAFRTWLFAVICRTAAERRRRARVRRLALARGSGGSDGEVSAPADPALDAETRQRAARLRDALEQLARRQREVLHLVFYGGLTLEEAASVMGVSLGSARTHYARGKSRLRELLLPEDRP